MNSKILFHVKYRCENMLFSITKTKVYYYVFCKPKSVRAPHDMNRIEVAPIFVLHLVIPKLCTGNLQN